MANITEIINHINKCIKSCESKEQLITCRRYIDIAFNPKICKELSHIRIASIKYDFDTLLDDTGLVISRGKPKPERRPSDDEQQPTQIFE